MYQHPTGTPYKLRIEIEAQDSRLELQQRALARIARWFINGNVWCDKSGLRSWELAKNSLKEGLPAGLLPRG